MAAGFEQPGAAKRHCNAFSKKAEEIFNKPDPFPSAFVLRIYTLPKIQSMYLHMPHSPRTLSPKEHDIDIFRIGC
jgi:hypothetical protein